MGTSCSRAICRISSASSSLPLAVKLGAFSPSYFKAMACRSVALVMLSHQSSVVVQRLFQRAVGPLGGSLNLLQLNQYLKSGHVGWPALYQSIVLWRCAAPRAGSTNCRLAGWLEYAADQEALNQSLDQFATLQGLACRIVAERAARVEI